MSLLVTASPSRTDTTHFRQPLGWPARATLLDADGRVLCAVELCTLPGDWPLILGDISEPSILLDYFFGQGGRQIMLQADDQIVEGRLATRWDSGSRSWWLDVDERVLGG